VESYPAVSGYFTGGFDCGQAVESSALEAVSQNGKQLFSFFMKYACAGTHVKGKMLLSEDIFLPHLRRVDIY
jgi:hypothetical protein